MKTVLLIAYKKGKADGYSQAEKDYYKQTEKDRQSSYDCGYQQGAKEFVEWLLHQDKVMYDSVSKDFYTCDDEHYIISTLSVDEVLVEWKKGTEE